MFTLSTVWTHTVDSTEERVTIANSFLFANYSFGFFFVLIRNRGKESKLERVNLDRI